MLRWGAICFKSGGAECVYTLFVVFTVVIIFFSGGTIYLKFISVFESCWVYRCFLDIFLTHSSIYSLTAAAEVLFLLVFSLGISSSFPSQSQSNQTINIFLQSR